ncbi:MAG: SAP domain-containing protein [Candidatus Poseidoniaceae archaeon]|nr:SAP domain-containing protein [Candidatus Poseidoniaceae archaeon]
MDYDSLTLLDLKTMCKERGLRVSGNKAEVVIRLMEDDESKSPQPAPSPQQRSNLANNKCMVANNLRYSLQTTQLMLFKSQVLGSSCMDSLEPLLQYYSASGKQKSHSLH